MEPVISALSKKYQGKMVFLIVDLEKVEDLSIEKLTRDFNIQYIPTIILLNRQGQVVERHGAGVSEEILTKQIDQLVE